MARGHNVPFVPGAFFGEGLLRLSHLRISYSDGWQARRLFRSARMEIDPGEAAALTAMIVPLPISSKPLLPHRWRVF